MCMVDSEIIESQFRKHYSCNSVKKHLKLNMITS